jgi:hypothetical protein
LVWQQDPEGLTLPKKDTSESRSILRLLLWEGLAAAGFLHLRLHPIADPIWSMNFFYNSLFFLTAYPILYVYRWKLADGCLGMVMWPLSFALSWGMGASAYLWILYGFYFTGNPFFRPMADHFLALGALFILVYFPLLEPALGVSRRYYSLGQLFWIYFYSALGGFIGYETGWFISQKFASVQADRSHWFLLWVFLMLLGTAAGALLAQRRLKQ